MKRKMIYALLASVMVLAAGCGNQTTASTETATSTESSVQESTEAATTEPDNSASSEADLTNEDTSEAESSTEAESETDAVTEAEQQEAFSFAAGDGKYVDLDDMHFYINGKKYTLGKTTLQEMIDDGVPFKDDDIANAGNNMNPSTESGGFKITLAEYCSAQVYVLNDTSENKKASECYINKIYLPTSQQDGQTILSFEFPTSATEEEIRANAGEPTKENQYDGSNGYVSRKIEYTRESNTYIGDYGYTFEFANGNLQYITIDYMP